MGDESMRAAPDRMALLYRRLLKTAAAADVRLLSGDQVLVSRNMVPNPALKRDGKAATYVPGAKGYQVHVACRSAEEHAELAALSQQITGPSSRPVAWDRRTMRLRVDPAEAARDWVLSNGRGEIVTVHADPGSPRVIDEVNAVLSEVEAVLLT